MRDYYAVLRYAFRQWPKLLVLVALNALAAAVAALQPWPLKLLIDHALGDVQRSALPPVVQRLTLGLTPVGLVGVAAGTTLVLFVLTSALNAGLTWTWMVAGRRMVYDAAADVFRRLQRMSLLFHARRRVGDSLALVTEDVWAIYTATNAILVGPLRNVFTLFAMGFLAWRLDPALTVVTLAIVPALAASARFFGRRLVERARRAREAQTALFSFVQQTVTALPVVHAFGAEDRNLARFRDLTSLEIDRLLRDHRMDAVFGMVRGLIPAVGTAVVLVMGGQRVLAGSLTIGSGAVFLAYMRAIQGSLRGLFNNYATLNRIQVSLERVFEVLDSEELVQDAPGARPLPARISGEGAPVRFEGVVFGYEPGRPVLRDVTLDVAPGETIALVGATGAGKSTAVSLVPRFFDPWEGRVTVGGQDVRTVQLDSLREQITLVLQEPFILPVTVAQNIAYGRPHATRAEVEAVARAANAHGFIEQLPQGYDTIVGERGATLSGGERQRLAIARAFLKDAPILILDEPTSALDAGTEALVMDAFDRLMRGRTTLIIAHRLSTARRAHRIVVLERGEIVEVGGHDELCRALGPYHRLHEAQSVGAVAVPA